VQILPIYVARTELASNFLRRSYKDFAPTEHKNRQLGCSQNGPAKRCSGLPPISSSTARTAPSCGFRESCSGLNVNRADVINNVLPSLPPQVQEPCGAPIDCSSAQQAGFEIKPSSG